jgi:hypothetical protein
MTRRRKLAIGAPIMPAIVLWGLGAVKIWKCSEPDDAFQEAVQGPGDCSGNANGRFRPSCH